MVLQEPENRHQIVICDLDGIDHSKIRFIKPVPVFPTTLKAYCPQLVLLCQLCFVEYAASNDIVYLRRPAEESDLNRIIDKTKFSPYFSPRTEASGFVSRLK